MCLFIILCLSYLVKRAMKPDAVSLDSYGSYGIIDDSKDDTGLTDTQPAQEASVQAEITEPDEDPRLKYQKWRDQSDMSKLDW